MVQNIAGLEYCKVLKLHTHCYKNKLYVEKPERAPLGYFPQWVDTSQCRTTTKHFELCESLVGALQAMKRGCKYNKIEINVASLKIGIQIVVGHDSSYKWTTKRKAFRTSCEGGLWKEWESLGDEYFQRYT